MDFNLKQFLLYLIIILSSCQKKDLKKSNALLGEWSFYSYNLYGELYIKPDSLQFKVEGVVYGPYEYSIEEDSLKYYCNKAYKIIFEHYNSVILKNDNENEPINLNRITIFSLGKKYETDPFYIRRNNYLVNANIIGVDSAINSLCSSIKIFDFQDTILHIKR